MTVQAAFAGPGPRTAAAFDRYMAQVEAVISREQNSQDSFLTIDRFAPAQRAEAQARLRRGEVLVERRSLGATRIPGGLIHHWRGIVLIPNATVGQVLALVQDYDHTARYYSPEVVSSRLLSHSGGDFHIFMRLRKHKVVTVVLDTEYAVHYGLLDATHHFSVSRSTRVAEIADAGEPGAHSLEHDNGFMWRLNTYWRFVQVPNGVLTQCEAVSLTRDVPTGLGWMIGPFVQDISRALQFTLTATRNAVLAYSATLARQARAGTK
jgi:hypothetical protein